MRDSGFDMWLVICQEDNWDPIHDTFCPMDPWRPILQMLVLFDRGPQEDVERINLSMTNMQGLYDTPWQGKDHPEQWAMLRQIVEQRDPKRIGINIGRIQWAAGGLTHNLYRQLVETLPPRYVERLDSAEPMVVHWASVLSTDEIELYEHVATVAKSLIAEAYSREVIVPGVTTLDDLVWHYWQRCSDLGLPVCSGRSSTAIAATRPRLSSGPTIPCSARAISCGATWGFAICGSVAITSSGSICSGRARPTHRHSPATCWPRPIACRDVFMDQFRAGLTGNQLLANILARARRENIPGPKVYSHSLGQFLHQPGPLIGLPWEQDRCEGRGDVMLRENTAFTRELSVERSVPEWGKENFRLGVEEDVLFCGGPLSAHPRADRKHSICADEDFDGGEEHVWRISPLLFGEGAG